jgi:hypothetical protein
MSLPCVRCRITCAPSDRAEHHALEPRPHTQVEFGCRHQLQALELLSTEVEQKHEHASLDSQPNRTSARSHPSQRSLSVRSVDVGALDKPDRESRDVRRPLRPRAAAHIHAAAVSCMTTIAALTIEICEIQWHQWSSATGGFARARAPVTPRFAPSRSGCVRVQKVTPRARRKV